MALHRIASRLSVLLCLGSLLPAASNLAAQTVEPQAGLINRDAAAFSPTTGKLYLIDTAGDAVTSVTSDGQSRSIKVGTRPDAVAVNGRTGMVYVVNPGSRNVSVIDSSSDTVVATVPTAARPYALAVDEQTNKVYVSNTFSSMVTVIDGASNQPSDLKLGSADIIMVDPDRKRIYLFGYETDAFTELNPADGSTSKIPVGAMHLWGLARRGGTMYVSHVQDANIAAIDLETHAIRTLATGRMPCAIVSNPQRDELYVANYADGTVTILHGEAPVATVPVMVRAQSLSLDADRGLLYVASPQQRRVDVIDLRERRVIRRIDVAEHPYAVAIQPQTHVAYAVNVSSTSFTPLKGR